MKIWNMKCDVNKYSGYFVSDENIIESINSLINRGITIDNWKTVKIRRDNEINEDSNIAHLWSIVGCFIVDKKAKTLLEKSFPGKIQFLDVIDEDNKEELYLTNILECIDAIDYEKSVLKIYLNKYIGGVEEYVFREDALDNPIFKLKLNNVIMPSGTYTNDDFRNTFNDLDLTGIIFEELYDSQN